MTEIARQPTDMLPLPGSQLHILMALADGEKHGYAIMREIAEMTDGEVTMGPGTLYGTIKRMLASGMIEETAERPDPDLDDERRRYYRATGFGMGVLDAETARLRRLVETAQTKRAAGRPRPAFQGGLS